MNVTIGTPDGDDVLHMLGELSNLVLRARHEEDFLERLAHVLREYVQCDAVIVRLLERHIQTRAVATTDGVHMLPPDELWEPFTEADRELWIAKSEGIHCDDIDDSQYIKPKFREHAARLRLKSGFMVPVIRDGDLNGQIIFAWSVSATLSEAQKERLRKLTDYASVQFTLFNVRQGRELDEMTGLLNRLGLRRRWEMTVAKPRGIVFFMEVTGLKSVADARGHLAAEDLLRQTSRVLIDESGPQVALARYGDNQFVLLAPNMSNSRGDELRQSFVQRFDALVATLPPPYARCGVGMAQWPRDGTDLEHLIITAEQRLTDHKRRRVKLTMTTKGYPRHGRMPRTFIDGWLVSSPDGVLVTDTDRKVIYVNRAYERMSGYSLQQWLGKTPGFIASGKTPPAVYEEMWDQLESEGAWMGKVVNRHRLGNEWISFLSITQILDRSGRPAGFLGIARKSSRNTHLHRT